MGLINAGLALSVVDGLTLSVVFLYLWVILLERKIRALEKRTA